MNVIVEASRHFGKRVLLFPLLTLLGWVTLLCALTIPQLIQLLLDNVLSPALNVDAGAAASSNSSIFQFILAGFAPDDYFGMFGQIVKVFALLLALRFVSHYFRWNFNHALGVSCEKRLRDAAFSRLINQNTYVLNRYTQGDLMSVCNSDATIVKDAFVHHMQMLTDQFIAIGLGVYFLSRISPWLIIAPAALGVFLTVFTAMYIIRLRRVFNNIRTNSARLNSYIQETINGIKVIKSFAREPLECQKFTAHNESYKESLFGHAELWSKFQAVFAALGQIIYYVSLALAIGLGVTGKMSVGEFTTYLTYTTYINNPMVFLSNILGNLQQALVCGHRLFTFINTENIIRDADDAVRITKPPAYELCGVDLDIDGKAVLSSINLSVPYGKTVGIMGKTGSGKSALLKVLSRNFEVTRGKVLINGTDIKQTAIDDVRRQLSCVLQDVFLFSNTVDSNIALYNPDAPAEATVHAAQMAEADGFIRKLSDGYETIVGERGLGLSGGQKQRVSIARALFKNAPVIMLDDATGALDMETERRVYNNIRENYPDRTLIIVSHRASAVAFCDEILFMENGSIVERGNHASLMNSNGRYAEVYLKQAAALADIEPAV